MSHKPNPKTARREDCGYTPAKQRTDNCKGCARVAYGVRDPDTTYEREVMECVLHRMPVAHGSICEDWEKRK